MFFQHIVLTPSGVKINGITFAEGPLLDEILLALGNPACRESEILDQGKPWRKFVICDSLGIYILYDFEINRALDFHVCFIPSKTVHSPKNGFSEIIIVNGKRLIAGMGEASLPVKGEFSFEKRGGWTATSDALFAPMILKKGRLSEIGITFLRRPRFSCESHPSPN